MPGFIVRQDYMLGREILRGGKKPVFGDLHVANLRRSLYRIPQNLRMKPKGRTKVQNGRVRSGVLHPDS